MSRLASRRGRAHRVIVAVELLTGGSALLCSGLLALRPDGSLLGLPVRVLAGGPFSDWRLPGLLLGGLVGVGYLVAGILERGRYRWSGLLPQLGSAEARGAAPGTALLPLAAGPLMGTAAMLRLRRLPAAPRLANGRR
jgi:hypothetical protein